MVEMIIAIPMEIIIMMIIILGFTRLPFFSFSI